jgi:hypothetical protein
VRGDSDALAGGVVTWERSRELLLAALDRRRGACYYRRHIDASIVSPDWPAAPRRVFRVYGVTPIGLFLGDIIDPARGGWGWRLKATP